MADTTRRQFLIAALAATAAAPLVRRATSSVTSSVFQPALFRTTARVVGVDDVLTESVNGRTWRVTVEWGDHPHINRGYHVLRVYEHGDQKAYMAIVDKAEARQQWRLLLEKFAGPSRG